MSGGGKDRTDVLIFVEDPGAVNAVVDLPRALAASGLKTQTVAAGHAVEYLASFGADFTEPDSAADAAALIDAHNPRMVFSGTSENPDTLGLKLIAEARKRGLANVGFLDGPASADHRFRGSGDAPLAFAPEWILVPDAMTRNRYQALGHPVERIVDCGHPYFDRVRVTAAKLAKRGKAAVLAEVLPDAPPDRPVVVFLAEISTSLAPEELRRSPEYTLHGRGGSNLRTQIVLEEVLDAVALIEPRPYFVLRLHPKNSADEFDAYDPEIDSLSHSGLAADLVYAADLVIGMTTILLFEAALMGCPTLSITPKPSETEWLTSIGLGITPSVHTRDDLREILPRALADPGQVMGTPPGEVLNFGALERMADFISGLLADDTSARESN